MPRIKSTESNDPEFHRKELKQFISKLKRSYKKSGENYESFIKKLLQLFSDNPPMSWRFVNTTYQYPSFRIINRKSGRTTYFLHVHKFGLIIPQKFFLDQFKPMFERHNAFYGTAFEHIIDFSTFGERKQSQYIEAIKTMLNQTELISLNFAAY